MSTILTRRPTLINWKLNLTRIPAKGIKISKSVLTKIIAIAIPALLVLTCLVYGSLEESEILEIKDQKAIAYYYQRQVQLKRDGQISQIGCNSLTFNESKCK